MYFCLFQNGLRHNRTCWLANKLDLEVTTFNDDVIATIRSTECSAGTWRVPRHTAPAQTRCITRESTCFTFPSCGWHIRSNMTVTKEGGNPTRGHTYVHWTIYLYTWLAAWQALRCVLLCQRGADETRGKSINKKNIVENALLITWSSSTITYMFTQSYVCVYIMWIYPRGTLPRVQT